MSLISLTITLYLLLFSGNVIAQEEKNYIEYREVYGLKILVVEQLITEKMQCGHGFSDSNKNTLYKILVDSVLFTRDSTVYSVSNLKKVEYFILPKSIKIDEKEHYYLLAGNSSVRDYIVGFRVFKEDYISSMNNITQHSIFQGLETCYQLSLFDKIRLLLGAKKEKVYTKKRNERKKNKFYKRIMELTH